MEQVPSSWPVRNMGYTHMVNTHVITGRNCLLAPNILTWLITTFGGISQGAWIDQGSYVCFKQESDARMFEMVWCHE